MNKELSSTFELQEAVRTLKAYTLRISEAKSASPVSKTFSLMLAFLKGDQQVNTIKVAVDVIQRHRLLVQQLEYGTDAEKELAKSVSHAVAKYNDHFKTAETAKGIANIFSKTNESFSLPAIYLAPTKTVKCHFPAKVADEVSRRMLAATVPLSKQSKELFHMKVIALLERYGIASNPEARASVIQAPIMTAVEDDSTICTLTQTFSLFPGQTVIVKGASALDPKTLMINSLFPDSFSVSLESTQTGFPDPCQRHGWALAPHLLSEFPQRYDLLGIIGETFRLRKQLINDLLPKGCLVDSAKKMIKVKKQAFELCKSEILTLHRQLALSITKAASSELTMDHLKDTISNFYDLLLKSDNAYELLIDTHQQLSECYISKPYQKLLEAVVKGKDLEFGNQDSAIRYQAAHMRLNQYMHKSWQSIHLDTVRNRYMNALGQVLGQAAQKVILQHLSEDLVFIPPQLSSFEAKLQVAAYRQMSDFITELSTPLNNVAETACKMKEQLNSDIQLFESEEKLEIATQFAVYYQGRYASLAAL